ncbi:MAG: STAS domain-containing protein [Azoarcus sp.]|jgi:anti-anti-sigma regulatory factor|nr:STAS domain-containing protein [Azoarcus sp.]
MVFSFFKKQPEKMVARPAASARSKETPPPPPVVKQAKNETLDASLAEEFSDFGLAGESSLGLQVDAEFDPVDGPAEEAAVLFANNQDQAAQAVLEGALKQLPSGPVERLWLMLFDLYRISGQRSAFEAMGIEYARAFEKSPPVWQGEAKPAPSAKAPKSGSVLFRGDLLGANASSFETVRQALEKSGALRLDMSKIKQIDPEGCASFLDILSHARKSRRGIDLKGRDTLIRLAQQSVEAGKQETPATGKECWLLLLELFQQQGQQEVFEELAIDYAVAFEESPPSWDAGRVKVPEPAAAREAEAEEDESGAADDDVYTLSGEVKSARFADLPAFVQKRNTLLIDCAKLTRIDFVSAGVLLNSLMSVRNTGKEIAFRHPNHLVAELFRVVGLSGVATIVFAKQ